MPSQLDLRAALRYEGGLSRRLFLAYGASLSALPLFGSQAAGQVLKQVHFARDPFALGVASGDPTHQGVVLWTRLAPEPLQGGGLEANNIEMRWEIAEDEAMKQIVQAGAAVATPQLGHSVHVEVEGLKSHRPYWYRFQAGDAVSPIGRTRTMPEPNSTPEMLHFAFASCQNYEQGLFTAYEHMAREAPDFVIHLGDYIYEAAGKDNLVRKHVGGKLISLEDYRNRHAQYRTDPLLQRMHASCPWIVTPDDHEFENNYAAGISEIKDRDPAEFLEQRANAYQAFYEMLPLRPQSLPRGPDMKLFRTVEYGRLIAFQVLDTRQYRSDQPNDDKASDLNDQALDPHSTMLGAKQAAWLKGALLRSSATWNVLAQQVMMGLADVTAGEEKKYSMDQWPGYAHERAKLLEFIAQRKVPNPVVLTGDIHANWVNDLRIDDRKLEEPVVATEFVGTSISSGGNGVQTFPGLGALLSENPFVKFHNRQRGYVSCKVTPTSWRSDYQVIDQVLKPGGGRPLAHRSSSKPDAPALSPRSDVAAISGVVRSTLTTNGPLGVWALSLYGIMGVLQT